MLARTAKLPFLFSALLSYSLLSFLLSLLLALHPTSSLFTLHLSLSLDLSFPPFPSSFSFPNLRMHFVPCPTLLFYLLSSSLLLSFVSPASGCISWGWDHPTQVMVFMLSCLLSWRRVCRWFSSHWNDSPLHQLKSYILLTGDNYSPPQSTDSVLLIQAWGNYESTYVDGSTNPSQRAVVTLQRQNH